MGRVFEYQSNVSDDLKGYYKQVMDLSTDLKWLKNGYQDIYDELKDVDEMIRKKQSGGADEAAATQQEQQEQQEQQRKKKKPTKLVSKEKNEFDENMENIQKTMKGIKDKIEKLDVMIFQVENISVKFRNRYGLGKGEKSKEVRYYEEILDRLNNVTDYNSYEFSNICKQ